jgi:hypothetical protein
MQSKTRVRLAAFLVAVVMVGGWLFISYTVLQDYLDLLNHEQIVTFSPLALWFPVGGFGALLYVIFIIPKVFLTGDKVPLLISRKTASLWDRVILFFCLIGVAFSVGWSYHTFDLMDRYDYVYSEDLNKHAGTSIYRKWIRVIPSN